MLYIYDLGNVILDVDVKRSLGVWGHLSGVPLAELENRFRFGRACAAYECGEISDQLFAQNLCDELGLALSFDQFCLGWQAMLIDVRPETLETMRRLRRQGDRVVILSNTNSLHYEYWSTHYPQINTAADQLYLSYQLGLRKPDPQIYHEVLFSEKIQPQQAVLFDNRPENIAAAQAIGIKAVLVNIEQAIPSYD